MPESSFVSENAEGAPGWLSPVKRPTSAQVMIPWSVSSSPTSGSVLTAKNLEPDLFLCLPLYNAEKQRAKRRQIKDKTRKPPRTTQRAKLGPRTQ